MKPKWTYKGEESKVTLVPCGKKNIVENNTRESPDLNSEIDPRRIEDSSLTFTVDIQLHALITDDEKNNMNEFLLYKFNLAEILKNSGEKFDDQEKEIMSTVHLKSLCLHQGNMNNYNSPITVKMKMKRSDRHCQLNKLLQQEKIGNENSSHIYLGNYFHTKYGRSLCTIKSPKIPVERKEIFIDKPFELYQKQYLLAHILLNKYEENQKELISSRTDEMRLNLETFNGSWVGKRMVLKHSAFSYAIMQKFECFYKSENENKENFLLVATEHYEDILNTLKKTLPEISLVDLNEIDFELYLDINKVKTDSSIVLDININFDKYHCDTKKK